MSNANVARRSKQRVLVEHHSLFECPRSTDSTMECFCGPGGPLLIETWLPVTDERRDRVAAVLAVKWETLSPAEVERIAKVVGL